MATDDERREVARRMREAAEGKFDFCAHNVALEIGMDDPSDFDDCFDGEHLEAWRRLADLIDRPTCHNKQVVYNRTAPKEFRTDNFTCSACGETFCADFDGVNHPIDWAFCPNCGAEVLND